MPSAVSGVCAGVGGLFLNQPRLHFPPIPALCHHCDPRALGVPEALGSVPSLPTGVTWGTAPWSPRARLAGETMPRVGAGGAV